MVLLVATDDYVAWKAWIRSRSPSIIRKLTVTVSPGAELFDGRFRRFAVESVQVNHFKPNLSSEFWDHLGQTSRRHERRRLEESNVLILSLSLTGRQGGFTRRRQMCCNACVLPTVYLRNTGLLRGIKNLVFGSSRQASCETSAVQNAHRVALMLIADWQNGQDFVVGGAAATFFLFISCNRL